MQNNTGKRERGRQDGGTSVFYQSSDRGIPCVNVCDCMIEACNKKGFEYSEQKGAV